MKKIEELVRGEGYTYWDGVQIGYTNTAVNLYSNYEVLPVYQEEKGSTPWFWLYLGSQPVIVVDIHSINNLSVSMAFLENDRVGAEIYKTGNIISKNRQHTFEYRPVDDRNPKIYAKGFCLHDDSILASYEKLTSFQLIIRCEDLKYKN